MSEQEPQSKFYYRVRPVSTEEVLHAKVEGVGQIASLLPLGVNPDEFSYRERVTDAWFKALQEVKPENYKDHTIYFVQWFGSRVPRGIPIEGRTIDGVQHGAAYHLNNPEADARDWQWDEIGTYERVYEEVQPDEDSFARQAILLFVPKDKSILQNK